MQEIFEAGGSDIGGLLYEKILQEALSVIEIAKFAHNLEFGSVFELDAPKGVTRALGLKECDVGADLAIGLGCFYNKNNAKERLARTGEALRPGGLFVGAFFGAENLKELRGLFAKMDELAAGQAYPRFLPNIEIKNLGMLLKNLGFGEVVASGVKIPFEFGNYIEALRFVRANTCKNILKMRGGAQSASLLKKHLNLLDMKEERVYIEFDVLIFSCLK